jgi:poly(3-hydroxybutyrate) depolymerase
LRDLNTSFYRWAGQFMAMFAVFGLPYAVAQSNADAPTVTGTFTFNAWDGPALTIHYVEPSTPNTDAPIVIVMHGVQRNADEYRDNWIDLAATYNLRVYAPEFDADRFPGAERYNLGGISTRHVSSFDAIEPLFDAILARSPTKQQKFVLFGHSAGAQFVHRYTLFRRSPRLGLAISANAGWYTMPDERSGWPYGTAGLKRDTWRFEDWFASPLLIMLGDQDNDPADPNLRRNKETMAQGPHRYARGIAFVRAAKKKADALGLALAWSFKVVPGVAHDNRGMAEAAAPIIVRMFAAPETDPSER